MVDHTDRGDPLSWCRSYRGRLPGSRIVEGRRGIPGRLGRRDGQALSWSALQGPSRPSRRSDLCHYSKDRHNIRAAHTTRVSRPKWRMTMTTKTAFKFETAPLATGSDPVSHRR